MFDTIWMCSSIAAWNIWGRLDVFGILASGEILSDHVMSGHCIQSQDIVDINKTHLIELSCVISFALLQK